MKWIALTALILIEAAVPVLGASYDNLNAGIQLYNLRRWDAAISQFDKALAADDLAPSLQFIAHFDRGQSHLALEHYDLAIADYSASLGLRPADAQALLTRSALYFTMGKLDLAATDLDSLVVARPKLGTAYAIRAAVNAKRGNTNQSVQDLKTLLSLRPDDAGYGLEAGILQWEVGQISIAETNFAWSAAKGPGNIYAWLWDALTKVRQKKEVPRGSLPKFDKEKWPAPIVSLYLGEVTQDAVFAAAAKGEDSAVTGQACEANFYMGEWLLQHQDRAAAIPLIRKAASNCPINFVEWGPAQMELANLP